MVANYQLLWCHKMLTGEVFSGCAVNVNLPTPMSPTSTVSDTKHKQNSDHQVLGQSGQVLADTHLFGVKRLTAFDVMQSNHLHLVCSAPCRLINGTARHRWQEGVVWFFCWNSNARAFELKWKMQSKRSSGTEILIPFYHCNQYKYETMPKTWREIEQKTHFTFKYPFISQAECVRLS